ncbi:hypothetical protein [Pseudomonas extremaustralis]|uniref:Uncharacterized protein n=1 Tax=Pseudomonas extremaustralis TaxID=359110 RepID=A0ABY0NJR7_9PSED|nr:hypothetical protein [Pseudomonas extremaustralis]MDB1113556.1 hypothetical protein [Pseudomonas extremaustralis]SDF58349.1 hypothetical protein SAMN05216591_3375 [Pseudomonas extremaustralis]
MARIELKLKATRRWWLMPLLNCAAAWYWITGRNEIAPGFIDWLVRHGLTIEVE